MFKQCCWIENCGPNDDMLKHAAAQTLTGEMRSHIANFRLDTKGNSAPSDMGKERMTLHVPADFSVRTADSAASSSVGSGYASLTEEQKAREMAKLQNMIRGFVREVLQGVHLDVVLEDASLMPCRCCMDNKLSVLSLQVGDIVRHIAMTSIQEICSGKELKHIRTTTPLDDLCATLVMRNDQCVTFKFKNVQAREHFATCMKVLRLALE